MKPLLISLSLLSLASVANAESGAVVSTVKYGANVSEEYAEDGLRAVELGYDTVKVPVKEATTIALDQVLRMGNDLGSRVSRDAVKIASRTITSEYLKEKGKNKELKKLQKEQGKRADKLDLAQKKAEDLEDLVKSYEKDTRNFDRNMSEALNGIAKSSKKLEGWDDEKQEKLEKLLEEHKKLGEKTAEDGKPRVTSHTVASIKELWVELETSIKKSPTAAKKLGLNAKYKTMSNLLEKASNRAVEKEEELAAKMIELNELQSFDEQSASDDISAMQRQMALGVLNNSVNNLISDLRYAKNRSLLAFSHFNQIEKEIEEKGVKGVKSGDIKNEYKGKSQEIAAQYNNTPIGVYVNSQISKAMGSVCEMVNNQCSDGSNAKFFDFLDDSKRLKLKLEQNSSPAAEVSGTATK